MRRAPRETNASLPYPRPLLPAQPLLLTHLRHLPHQWPRRVPLHVPARVPPHIREAATRLGAGVVPLLLLPLLVPSA